MALIGEAAVRPGSTTRKRESVGRTLYNDELIGKSGRGVPGWNDGVVRIGADISRGPVPTKNSWAPPAPTPG